MSDKLKNFTEDIRDGIENEVTAGAKTLGYDRWDGMRTNVQIDSKWGICKKCSQFEYCKTEFGKEFARCAMFQLVLNLGDRMKECTMFQRVGVMSLEDMSAIAYIIEAKRNVGFTQKV